MSPSRYIIIVGCGRLGSDLANRLSREGHALVVIDREESAFDGLSPDFSGFRLEGDATQVAVLRQAHLDKADTLIAATHEDNVNLMVAQVARRIFGVARVVARVFDPRREQVYTRLEIETICPTTVAAEMFLGVVRGDPARPKGHGS
jgi:trk system potassium uptake protein TrkA